MPKTCNGSAARFDPAVVDADRLARDLAALAKRWSRPPAASRKRST
jgi:hypothetical protein